MQYAMQHMQRWHNSPHLVFWFACRFLQSLDASAKLHQNMQQQHSCLLQFTMTVALRLADKFHGAILIVQSFPWSPDVLSIVNVIAQEDDEPSSGMAI